MRYAIATALIVGTTILTGALPARSAETGTVVQPGKLPRVDVRNDGSAGVDLGHQRASTFGDALRYADMLGRQASRGGSIAFAGGLGSSRYGLLDPKTSRPRPGASQRYTLAADKAHGREGEAERQGAQAGTGQGAADDGRSGRTGRSDPASARDHHLSRGSLRVEQSLPGPVMEGRRPAPNEGNST